MLNSIWFYADYLNEDFFHLNTKTEQFAEGDYICLDERIEAGEYAIFGVKDGNGDAPDGTREYF